MGIHYDPWAHAQDLGLTVIEKRLDGTRRGEYWHDQQLVILRKGMSQRAARSTLAHEVAHAVAGDRPTVFGPMHRRAEIRASRTAATWLVNADEYAVAEQLHAGHLPAIAYELNVTTKVLTDWVALRRAQVAA